MTEPLRTEISPGHVALWICCPVCPQKIACRTLPAVEVTLSASGHLASVTAGETNLGPFREHLAKKHPDYLPPLPTELCKRESHERDGACSWCCETCNYDLHRCHFCGDSLRHNGLTLSGEPNPCYVNCPACGQEHEGLCDRLVRGR